MSKNKKSPVISRGYSIAREKAAKSSKFLKSCYNCEYYYQSEEDTEEVCQNPNVLPYDMVITSSNIYCSLWKLSSQTTNKSKEKLKKCKSRKNPKLRRIK